MKRLSTMPALEGPPSFGTSAPAVGVDRPMGTQCALTRLHGDGLHWGRALPHVVSPQTT